MQTMQIDVAQDRLDDFCQRHHITRMAFYGSVLRDEFHPSSDVDVLVAFDPAHIPGWEMIGMMDELQHLLGRDVDMTTFDALHPLLSERILESMRMVYERA